MSTLKTSRLSYVSPLALAAGLGTLYVLGGMTMSNLGMDWGYYLVDKVWPQTHGNEQWFGAVLLGSFISPAIYGSMSVALAKRVLGGNRIWWGVLSFPVMYGMYVLIGDWKASEFASGLGMLAAWTALLTCCFRAFDWVVGELSKRCNVTQLMLCSALAFVPVAVASLLSVFPDDGSGINDIALVSSMVRYFAVLFAASVAVPFAVGTRERSAAAAASVFAFLPIVLFSVVNVAYASLWLHDLHAVLSSILILATTLAATTGGAAIGALRRHA